MRYLVVFGHKGWEVIDTDGNNAVVKSGTIEEMKQLAADLNSNEEVLMVAYG